MAAMGICGLKPSLFRPKSCAFEAVNGTKMPKLPSKARKEASRGSKGYSIIGEDQLIIMKKAQKKILTFRDIMDLSPCSTSASFREIIIRTLEDLQRLYPGIIPSNEVSRIKKKPMDQVLTYFCKALKSVGEFWLMNKNWMDKPHYEIPSCEDNNIMQLGETLLATLDCLAKMANEKFDVMDEDDQKKEKNPESKLLLSSSSVPERSISSSSSPPVTPTSVLPEELGKYLDKGLDRSSQLCPLRVQSVRELNPIDVKQLCFHMDSPQMEILSKIEEEPIEDKMTMDDKSSNADKITSEDLVLDSDAAEELQVKTGNKMEIPNKIEEEASGDKMTMDNQSSNAEKITSEGLVLDSDAAEELQIKTDNQMEIPSKIEKEASGDKMTMDNQSSNAEKITSEDLVLDLDTAEELQIKTGNKMEIPRKIEEEASGIADFQFQEELQIKTANHGESDKPQVVTDLGKPLSPKQRQSPSPSISPPSSLPQPPPLQLPPPPPLLEAVLPPPLLQPSSPPLVPRLQQNTASIGMPSPSTPELPQGLGPGSAAPPPPPPLPSKVKTVLAPPPPMLQGNGIAPLSPPPIGARRSFSLRARATTKLKRSTQIGNLYRYLKGRVEGTILNSKSFVGKKSATWARDGGKRGMAEALAEMTKRSYYFQQIEEDVQKYSKQITELSSSITNFKTGEMSELIKFHEDVESILENLTDESQVLSRFEGFPTKKLEAIRMAAALYKKLDSILTEFQNWRIEPPLGRLLDKIERYFDKIKTELDALDRSKDEESKKLKSHNIEFNFHYLVKIKEAVVDVSSNCMELALKERREDADRRESGSRSAGKDKECAKMLWRAFQFAFRVYTFAGGHDDRADKLTRELAREIESEPHLHDFAEIQGVEE